ncbi:MAG: hypothetical protein JRH20_08920 [Deltaproteobacteria bacterium]|nr:hypothetical protein [Deltaproteobacteria bacterium]
MDAFSIAELAEEISGEIYDTLAAFFVESPALQRLFAKLAEEEREHAQRVRDLAGLWRESGKPWTPALDVERMVFLVDRARVFRDSLGQAEVIEPTNAIRLAASMEQDFNAAHAEAMAKEQNPEMKALFEQLAEGDDGHSELLLQLANMDVETRVTPREEQPLDERTQRLQRWLKGAEEQLRSQATETVVESRRGTKGEEATRYKP